MDVARAAKVSTATVSYVLNGRGHVSEETRDRVRQAIKDLNYQPNAAGRSLATDSARAIGLLAPRATAVSDPFFALFLAGVLEASRKARYQLVLLSPEMVPGETERAIIRAVRSKRVDGVILLEVEPNDRRAEFMVEQGIPVVLFGRSSLALSWVDVDNTLGGFLATRHLLQLGHRRIAHIAAPDRYQYARLRREGYEKALREEGRALVPWIVEGDLTVQSGYALGGQLLTHGGPPTGIFVASDVMAEGVIRSALELGIRVPEQLSVVGFDDSPLAQQTFPPLTTVSQNAYQVGERVADLMVACLEEQVIEQVMVKPVIKVRKTTATASAYVPAPEVGQGIMLKNGGAFAWLSSQGMVDPVLGTHGVFFRDTHWVNVYQVLVDGQRLEPLAMVLEDSRFKMSYAISAPTGGTLHLTRGFDLFADHFEDTWQWQGFGTARESVIELRAAPDFRDIFEIRGMAAEPHRAIISELGAVEVHRYRGRDGIDRTLTLRSQPEFRQGSIGDGRWTIPGGSRRGALTISVSWEDSSVPDCRQGELPDLAWPQVDVADPQWQQVLERSRADIEMLLMDFGQGPLPAAGLPWYGSFFGRDAIISAYELLPYLPELAERVLASLAYWQGRSISPEREEMPGKMVHEIRSGELTNVGVVPFGRYYGSVDATPLFLILLVATWRRTGDNQLLKRYLSVAEKALAWMDVAGGPGTDGLYHFNPQGSAGLAVQSWKDSKDSMVYGDGRQAEPPLAVAEVQGYVYAAKRAMAALYGAIGKTGAQDRLEAEAFALRETFQRTFWMPSLKYYAMAVDGRGAPLDVVSSDPGQCLWTGIIPETYRPHVVKHLLSEELFNGWGIRTLASSEAAYDPFSYHRGSVWPHDTALIIAGLAASGHGDAALQVARGLIDAAAKSPFARLPELFSGIDRQTNDAPVPYPGACAPQAWAAGAPWLVWTALLGLDIDAGHQTIKLDPVLGDFPNVCLTSITLPGGILSLAWSGGVVQVKELPRGWKVLAAKEVVERISVSVPERIVQSDT